MHAHVVHKCVHAYASVHVEDREGKTVRKGGRERERKRMNCKSAKDLKIRKIHDAKILICVAC